MKLPINAFSEPFSVFTTQDQYNRVVYCSLMYQNKRLSDPIRFDLCDMVDMNKDDMIRMINDTINTNIIVHDHPPRSLIESISEPLLSKDEIKAILYADDQPIDIVIEKKDRSELSCIHCGGPFIGKRKCEYCGGYFF